MDTVIGEKDLKKLEEEYINSDMHFISATICGRSDTINFEEKAFLRSVLISKLPTKNYFGRGATVTDISSNPRSPDNIKQR